MLQVPVFYWYGSRAHSLHCILRGVRKSRDMWLTVSSAAKGRPCPGRQLVINLGIAKTGTTSLLDYFTCNNFNASHNVYRGARRLRKFLSSGHGASAGHDAEPLWRDIMGDYDAHLELNDAPNCDFPQVDHAARLIELLPHACFLLSTRHPAHWVSSVRRFGDGILERQMRASCPEFSRGRPLTLAEWYDHRYRRVRAAMPRARCALELDIESSDAGSKLASWLNGTHSYCWGHSNPSQWTNESIVRNSMVRSWSGVMKIAALGQGNGCSTENAG